MIVVENTTQHRAADRAAPIVGRADSGPVSHTVEEITVSPLEFEGNCNHIGLATSLVFAASHTLYWLDL